MNIIYKAKHNIFVLSIGCVQFNDTSYTEYYVLQNEEQSEILSNNPKYEILKMKDIYEEEKSINFVALQGKSTYNINIT